MFTTWKFHTDLQVTSSPLRNRTVIKQYIIKRLEVEGNSNHWNARRTGRYTIDFETVCNHCTDIRFKLSNYS